jgi:hypothetical protein
MSKIQYSKEQLIQHYRPRPIDQLPNAKLLLTLQKNVPQLMKLTNQVPVNFHLDQFIIKGFN